MHRASGKQSSGKSFRRLVLLNEDVYKTALQCMEEGAVSRMAERTQWYEKNTARGTVSRDYLYRDTTSTERLPPTDSARTPTAPSTPVSSLPSTSTAIGPLSVTEPEREPLEAVTAATHTEDLRGDLNIPTSNRKDIPDIHLKKYDALLKRLRLSAQVHVTSAGQVVFGQAPPIAGSNFHKLMRSMFVSSFASDRTAGRREFLRALRDFGVRATEVSSQTAKAALSAQGGSGSTKRKGPPGRRQRILRVY